MTKCRPALALLFVALGALSCAEAADPPTGSADRPTPSVSSDGEGRPSPHKSPRSDPTSQPPENPAPDFAVETFEGETFALAEQRGTPVVLNFWESW